MNTYIKYKEDRESQLKSGIITASISILLLLLLLFYTWTEKRISQQVQIAINFIEEPLVIPPKELIKEEIIIPKNIPEPSSSAKASASNKNISSIEKRNSSTSPKSPIASKIVTPKEAPVSAKKNNVVKKGPTDTERKRLEAEKATRNMLKNKNNSGGSGTSRTGSGTGLQDGLRDGAGDGKIGEGGRNLISFIPGTMGKGGVMPSHNCTASGRIWFDYTVDRTGKIISVTRNRGASNPCLVKAGKTWIKKHVHANTGSSSATGSYDIEF